jgi:elongation factor G
MSRIPVRTERIRNIGIIAHVDAGKTTLTERILFHTGRIHAIGEVHAGTAHTDSHAIEQQRGITILAAAVTCDWRDHRVHLIDTPGHVDFTIEVERSLRVLDGAVVVLDGVAGVEPQTETVWRQAERHGVPRLAFVNKLDRPGASYERAVRELASRLGARPVPVTIPLHDDTGDLVGVVDVVGMREITWPSQTQPSTPITTPASLSDNLRTARELVIEACADEDPRILEGYLANHELDPAMLWAALRRATLARRIVPVLAGSAYRYKGVEPLLDAVVALLPSPVDRGAVAADRPPTAAAAFAALAFKVVFDEHGQLTFVRVYSGAIARGDTVVATRTNRKHRVGRLVQLVAEDRIEVDRLEAGEIGAIIGMPVAHGETLCAPAPAAPIVLEAIHAPDPVVRVAIEAKTAADREKLGVALGRMVAADPSLRIESNPETSQTLLAGMGELHIEIAVERLATEHRVEVVTGAPLVAYRATVVGTARVEHRHVKQTGGPGQWAHVVLSVGPAARGAGLVFEDRIKGGALPREYIRGVAAGVAAAAADGLAEPRFLGAPLVDLHVVLEDGATHPNDSSELAFHIAGAAAFRAAVLDAEPRLLEPVMALEVTCPEDAVGAVVGDIARRRGQVLGLEPRAVDRSGLAGSRSTAEGRCGVSIDRVARAAVPLAETFGYANDLGAMTHGRGRFTLEPRAYELVRM